MKNKRYIIAIVVIMIIGIIAGLAYRYYSLEKEYTDYFTVREAAHMFSYVNMSGGGDIKVDMPEMFDGVNDENPINAGQIEDVFTYFGIDNPKLNFKLENMKDSDILSQKEFFETFDYIIANKPNSGIRLEQLLIINISKTETNQDEDVVLKSVVATQRGEYDIDGDVDDTYIDKIIDAYVYDNTIIKNMGESDKAVKLDNVWVEDITDGQISIFYDDFYKSYPCNAKVDNATKGKVADLVINNKGARDVSFIEEVVTGKVLAVTADGIYLEGQDTPLPVAADYKIYKIYGELASEKTAKILVGYNSTQFVLKDGIVEAALITDSPIIENIRVAISTSDYESLYHKEVVLTSESDMIISYGNKEETIPAGTEIDFTTTNQYLAVGDRCVIKSASENGRITLSNVKRSNGVPSYRGKIELAKYDDVIVVVNELPIEEYLYSVVPSEMPANYQLEALKAQAICARGYAYNAMINNTDFAIYGAHLDDSVKSQVYNNTDETDATTFAVKDTYGIVPLVGNEVITPYFFSTSCGTTSNNAEVWEEEEKAYLVDKYENPEGGQADLSNSDIFKQFIDNGDKSTDFEKDLPFYRWQVTFSTEELSEAINANLKERIEANPDNIIVITKDGDFVRKSISSIGQVTDVIIDKRGSSGIIMEMTIKGTTNSVKVIGQTNARALLSPKDVNLFKQDGTSVTNWATLPSAYYYITTDSENFTVYGGGFGHGVGMSQNGANVLAQMGYNSEYILNHYYIGIQLIYIYNSYVDIKKEEPITTETATNGSTVDGESTAETADGSTVEGESTTEAPQE